MNKMWSTVLSALLAIVLIFPQGMYAQNITNLPFPGTMISLSSHYTPAIVVGITIHPDNPLQFDFIIDAGDDHLEGEALWKESKKLISYFMAALTVPEDEMWVNLSPYEKDRIIAEGLGSTELGRDLLAQDYILKQITASLMYPEGELGRQFWQKVYKQAEVKFGTTEIPTNIFNKIWIIPEKAVLYINGTNVFVADSRLKVMLEEDYLALQHHDKGLDSQADHTDLTEEIKAIVREVFIPEIEREINGGKNFANLRQMYHSMILAAWYKKNLRKSLLGKTYVDMNKVEGINLENKLIKDEIYNQYVEAFQRGVYDYIREDYNPATQEITPRKYFSGGQDFKKLTRRLAADEDVLASSPVLRRDASRHSASIRVRLQNRDGGLSTIDVTPHSGNPYVAELERSLYAILEVYANVHRGAGVRSQASTELYEEARIIALSYAGKSKEDGYQANFMNTNNMDLLTNWLDARGLDYEVISTSQFGLNWDVNIVIAQEKDLPETPLTPGGGTVEASTEVEVRWADAPDRFEAGTPNIVGNILFGKVLQLSLQNEKSKDLFKADSGTITKEGMQRIIDEDPFSEMTGEELLKAVQDTFIAASDGVHVDHGASNITYALIGDVIARLLAGDPDADARRHLVDEAAATLRDLIHAPESDYDVIFTGNTTDASNILMRNVVAHDVRALQAAGKKVAILGSALEHNSSRLPFATDFEGNPLKNVSYVSLEADNKGFFNIQQMEDILKKHNSPGSKKPFIPLVMVTGASNVLGSFNEIDQMITLAHRYGTKVAIDGAQLLAHRQINLKRLDADYILFSGHKAYAPAGSGALVVKKGVLDMDAEDITRIRQDGERNIIGVAAFLKALQILKRITMETVVAHEQRVTRDLITKLKSLGDRVAIYGEQDDLSKRAGVVTITLKDFPVDTVARWLAEDSDVGTREGCFCAATAVFAGVEYKRKDIQGLVHLVGGKNIDLAAPRMLRFSLGLNNTEADNDRIIASLKRLLQKKPNRLERTLAKIFAQGPPRVITEKIAKVYAKLFGIFVDEVWQWDEDPRALSDGNEFQRVEAAILAARQNVFGKGVISAEGTASSPLGGIDFNTNNLDMDVHGKIDALTVSIDFPGIQPDWVNGAVPVILNIVPVANFPLLLGFDTKSSNELMSSIEDSTSSFDAFYLLRTTLSEWGESNGSLTTSGLTPLITKRN